MKKIVNFPEKIDVQFVYDRAEIRFKEARAASIADHENKEKYELWCLAYRELGEAKRNLDDIKTKDENNQKKKIPRHQKSINFNINAVVGVCMTVEVVVSERLEPYLKIPLPLICGK